MFSDYDKELLKSGIIEAKAGNREVARHYLDRALNAAHDHDLLAEAWFWMSEVLDDMGEKRKALENCLSYDLQHARARRVERQSGRRRPGWWSGCTAPSHDSS